jgi:hypothetical protein
MGGTARLPIISATIAAENPADVSISGFGYIFGVQYSTGGKCHHNWFLNNVSYVSLYGYVV